jgi:multiple sugar transport system permease protein
MAEQSLHPKSASRPARHGSAHARRDEWLLGYLLIMPLVLVILFLVYIPLLRGFNMSLHLLDYSQGLTDQFMGFKNYVRVIQDPNTLRAALNTAGYMLVTVVVELSAGVVFAVALNKPFRGRGLVLALMILPWALPGIVSGVLWGRIYHPDNGFLNNILFRMGVIQEYRLWFANRYLSIGLIALANVWSGLPLVILILLAGLQTISNEIYEAASVDGASAWNKFRGITLPLLRPSLAVALTLATISSLSLFDQIYVLNGVALETRSLTQQIYLMTFQQLKFGQGTALAFWLTLVTLVFSAGYIRSLRRAR